MRDADILDSHTLPNGILVEHIRVSPRVRAGILGMPAEIYAARHVDASPFSARTGATEEEAIAKLCSRYPELRNEQ